MIFITTLYLQAQAISPEKTKLLKQLFVSMKMEESLTKSLDSLLELQKKRALLKDAEVKVMKKFFDKYIKYENIEAKYILLYGEMFTNDEIKELIKFYQSPIGEKYSANQDILNSKGAEIGMLEVQKYSKELQKMFIEAQK